RKAAGARPPSRTGEGCMLRRGSWWGLALVASAALAQEALPAGEPESGWTPAPAEADGGGLVFDWGFEAKAHWRDSEATRNPSPFPFPPEFLPPGTTLPAFQETVSPGEHFEVSTLTLLLGARWGESITARAKVDFIDLYDRNP